MLGESDLELISALQIDPRASWQHLADVLGVAPSTLSRRWQSLTDAGLAWVTTAPGFRHLEAGSSAFLLLRVAPGRMRSAIEVLGAEPMFGTISRITGSYDLLIDCLASSVTELTGFLERGGIYEEEIARREVLVATRLFRDASWWRAGAIEPVKARRITERREARPAQRSRDATDAQLIDALGVDGRMSWAELAERCGISAGTARRRVESLLAAGAFSLRCDAVTSVRQGRRGLTLLLEVPAAHLERAGRWFGEQRDCRLCAEVVGEGNLLATLWPRDLADVHAYERELAEVAPGTRVVGRHIELSTVKRLGTLMDDQGRRTGRVPLQLVRHEAAEEFTVRA